MFPLTVLGKGRVAVCDKAVRYGAPQLVFIERHRVLTPQVLLRPFGRAFNSTAARTSPETQRPITGVSTGAEEFLDVPIANNDARPLKDSFRFRSATTTYPIYRPT